MKNLSFILLVLLVLLLFGCNNGSNGSDGNDAVDFTWVGEYESEPFACDETTVNNAYRNSTEGASYICDGEEWQVLAQDGDNGTDGTDGTNGQDGVDSTDGTDGNDSTSDTPQKYSLNGKAENGPCDKPGSINIYPLDSTLYQTGDPVHGYIVDDSGAFVARGTASGTQAYYEADNLTCFNEVSGGKDTGIKFFSLVDLTESERNLNPLTTIKYFVSLNYFDDDSHVCSDDINCAKTAAETAILSYFDMPETDKTFEQMTLQGSTSGDAVLAIIDSMIANGRTAEQQNSYMIDISDGVLNNNLTLKASIATQIGDLPIKTIKENLEGVYTSLGLGALCPPIWDMDFLPEYYANILTRTPTILEWINQNATSTITFDTTNYNSFAYPTVFNSIESAVYFASELDGDLSIWSVGTCNQGTDYPCPLAELVSIGELNEVLLESVMNYNGFLDDHGLTNGTQYFIVQEFNDYTHQPSHAADGDILPFGRNLAAIDNEWGAAIGWNNTTTWFRRSPKSFITD